MGLHWLKNRLTSKRVGPDRLDARQGFRQGYSGLAHILPSQAGVTVAGREKRHARLQVARLSGYLPVGKQMTWEALSPTCEAEQTKGFPMLYYALVFLIVGLVAGALGLAGVAGIASQIA